MNIACFRCCQQWVISRIIGRIRWIWLSIFIDQLCWIKYQQTTVILNNNSKSSIGESWKWVLSHRVCIVVLIFAGSMFAAWTFSILFQLLIRKFIISIVFCAETDEQTSVVLYKWPHRKANKPCKLGPDTSSSANWFLGSSSVSMLDSSSDEVS